MEGFGLFDLLNSMLTTPQKNNSSEEEKASPTKEPQTQETVPPKPNACVDFFEAHERRSRRRQ